MATDRSSIEKNDFPLSRRGYERAAVNAHLSEVADWFEGERDKPETLATTASEHVRSIVEAAESTAAEIRRRSEVKANSALEAARRDAERVRVEAARQAEEYVEKVRHATSSMLEQVQSMEEELGSLVGSVRSNGERLGGELAELTRELGNLTNVSAEWSGESSDDRSPSTADEQRYEKAEADPGLGGNVSELRPREEVRSPARVYDESAETASDEEQQARLVALDMAHSGTSREEADRYLADHYRLANRQRLLDEIYARVGQGKR